MPTVLVTEDNPLVVEDNAATRSLLRLTLELEGYRVLEASEAASAIAAAASVDGLPHEMMISPDMTKRRLLAQELERSEERYRKLVSSIPDVVWCGTAAHTFDVTANVEHLTGFTREEMMAESVDVWFSRIHVDDMSRVRAAFARFVDATDPLDVQYRYQHKNRSWRWLHARGVRTHEMRGAASGCVLVSDITQRRRIDDSVMQAQRMEAVGMLSGGVAHDFNNILAVVLTNCDFLAESLGPDDPRLADVAEIRRAGERGANLTRQLLAFSRRQLLEPSVLDVNEIVRDLQKMLRRLIGENIALVVQPDSGLGHVRADAGQLEQVLVNLVVNARDAIGTSGRVVIATSNASVDDAGAAIGVPPGEYVMFSVTDTGCGMDTGTIRRIFEPFFTTKEERGTGLGLSTTYGIVKQSGGHIVVTSKLGQGTTFEVYLPRLDRCAPLARRKQPTGKHRGGSETVLLIEDDDGVRTGIVRSLTARGYNVLPTRDGREALALLATYPEPIDLALTDLVMPGANGLEVAEAIRAHSMSVKVLLMSGFSDHHILQNGELPPGQPFIHKPFSGLALSNKIREVLDA
jgi:PAS domain S-box-containing protein